ncbi:MAG: DUF3592 domain-containing protein [Phycisphaerales bacterium]|jgi:hypothetical protein
MKMTLIAVFGVISLVMLAMGIYEFYMQQRLLANAQPVQVTITESGIVYSQDISTDNNGGVPAPSYSPLVKFTYELGGTPYESSLLRPLITGRTYTSHAAAANELTPFPVGARIQAFVNPTYPDKAYLLKETSRSPVIFMIIGVTVPIFIFAVIKIAKL